MWVSSNPYPHRRCNVSRISQQLGAHGEQLAVGALRRIGVDMIQKIATPVALFPVPNMTAAFRVKWATPVSGDHTGIARGGLFVLVEVKTCFGRNLRWSDFEDHQRVGLSEHVAHGGIALVVYVTDNGAHVLRWPIHGFRDGKGISPSVADALALIDEQGLLGRD